MSEVTDLDVLVPEDQKVTFGGRLYTVPGDLPLSIFLRISRVEIMQAEGSPAEETLGAMVSALADLLCWGKPDDEPLRAETETRLRGLGMRTITGLMGKLYPPDADPELGEGAAAAVDPQEPGTTKTSPPTPTSPTTETAAS